MPAMLINRSSISSRTVYQARSNEMEAIAAISSSTTGPSALDSALKTAIWSIVAIDLIVRRTKRIRGQWFHFCKNASWRGLRRRTLAIGGGASYPADVPPPLCNAGAEIGYGPMELPAEYWHERAERLRDIADFVDEQT